VEEVEVCAGCHEESRIVLMSPWRDGSHLWGEVIKAGTSGGSFRGLNSHSPRDTKTNSTFTSHINVASLITCSFTTNRNTEGSWI